MRNLKLIFAVAFVIVTSATLLFIRFHIYPQSHSTKLFVIEGINSAGVGALVKELRGWAVVSLAMNAAMSIEHKLSEHGYFIDEFLSPSIAPRLQSSRYCRINYDQIQNDLEQFADMACAAITRGEEASLGEIMPPSLRSLDDCDVVVFSGSLWIPEKYDACTFQWLKATKFGASVGEYRRDVVAIHVRWGDLAPGGSFSHEMLDGRTYHPEELNKMAAHLESYSLPFELYIQNHNSYPLDRLTFEYELVDSGDDYNEMARLSTARILALSGSSFAVPIAQLAAPELLVVKKSNEWQFRWSSLGLDSTEILYLEDIPQA